MVEFRTSAPGQTEESSSTLEKHLEKVWKNIKNDSEIQQRLLKEAAENDVDPVILRAFFGDSLPNQEELQQMTQENQAEVETEVITQKPEPEQVIGFLDEIIELAPEDMTLKELREWADDNSDIVETAIQMRF